MKPTSPIIVIILAFSQLRLQTILSATIYDRLVVDHGHDGEDKAPDDLYLNEWVVEVKDSYLQSKTGGYLPWFKSNDLDVEAISPASVDSLVRSLGFRSLGALPGFPNHYVMQRIGGHTSLEKGSARDYTQLLRNNPMVESAYQMFRKTRIRRGFLAKGQTLDTYNSKEFEEAKKHNMNASGEPIISNPERLLFNDELFQNQWYMNSRGDLDMGVIPIYRMNITGEGVRVVILDDGLDYTHPDLQNNFDLGMSFNYNQLGWDPYPSNPEEDNHGTRVAGVVAMEANNRICGVGVAFNAKVGMVKLLDGGVTDRVEGVALSHAVDRADIYVCSWGPLDDGKTVEGPGVLAQKGLIKGISEGRGGLGSIYVWAAGNGGSNADSCNCDGYSSSIFTISVGAISKDGESLRFEETCSSTMAVTFSADSGWPDGIVSTDPGGICTKGFTGTSASAPLAAGIIALVLEANPRLGWRDVQHLIARYAIKVNTDDPEWITNKAGLASNPRYGFGLLHGQTLVEAALRAKKNVGEPKVAIRESPQAWTPVARTPFSLDFTIVDQDRIRFTEHIEVIATFDFSGFRGFLSMVLESPSGTVSKLLDHRYLDESRKGFHNWKFMSVQFWGEDPRGTWRMKIKSIDHSYLDVNNMELVVYGTEEDPEIP